jgi:predicted lactoylglutathione lyase
MLSKTVKSIFPFVPSKDFELATQFYKDLGFSCPSDDEHVRTFTLGQFGFLLQDFYVEEWAKNSMMNLHVNDIDKWYKHTQDTKVTDKYPGTSVSPPKLEDWGMMVMHSVDPTGILWHITQTPKHE